MKKVSREVETSLYAGIAVKRSRGRIAFALSHADSCNEYEFPDFQLVQKIVDSGAIVGASDWQGIARDMLVNSWRSGVEAHPDLQSLYRGKMPTPYRSLDLALNSCSLATLCALFGDDTRAVVDLTLASRRLTTTLMGAKHGVQIEIPTITPSEDQQTERVPWGVTPEPFGDRSMISFISLITTPTPSASEEGPAGGWGAIRVDKRADFSKEGGLTHPGFSQVAGFVWADRNGAYSTVFSNERDAIESLLGVANRLRIESFLFCSNVPTLLAFVAARACIADIPLPQWFFSRSNDRWISDPSELSSPFTTPATLSALAVGSGLVRQLAHIEPPISLAMHQKYEEDSLRKVLAFQQLIQENHPFPDARGGFQMARQTLNARLR